MQKSICSILAFLILFAIVPISVFATEVETEFYQPFLSIKNQDIPSIDPDDTKTIRFSLENTGEAEARDIIMTPIFGENTPFTTNDFTNSISIGDIEEDEKEKIRFEIKVDSKAKPGNYPITLKFDYKYTGDYDTTYKAIYEEIIYIKVNSGTIQPQIIISEITNSTDKIYPGQDVSVDIFFENKGSIDTEDIKVRLEGLDSDEGFFIKSGSDLGYIKKVPGGFLHIIRFDLKTSKNIKAGTHELTAIFNYEGKEEPQKIYLTVEDNKDLGAKLSVENLEYPNKAISPNKDFTLKFDLKNNSNLKASDIIINVDSPDESIVPRSLSIKKLDVLDPDCLESFSFVFSPTEDSITRTYPININISYEDELNEGEENRIEMTEYVAIYAYNPKDDDDTKKSTPKLIIDKYSFEPHLVRAGEEFTMNLSFFNTNNIRSVKNIKIFLTADEIVDSNTTSTGGSVFTPVNTSNTFYIDSIPPKGRVQKKVTMFTVPDAKAKTYTMTANFEYEDSEANPYTATELIGVPVVQQSRLDIGELQYMPESFIGESAPISLEFYNTGKVPLYNMMVKIEGDFQTENAQYYIGNFDSGSSEFFEGYIIPNEPGPLKGDVVFTYEDSTGKEQELRREFNLNVIDMPPMDEEFLPEDIDESSSGIKKILKSPFFWIILISATVITGVVIKKKKNKKEEELSLDE